MDHPSVGSRPGLEYLGWAVVGGSALLALVVIGVATRRGLRLLWARRSGIPSVTGDATRPSAVISVVLAALFFFGVELLLMRPFMQLALSGEHVMATVVDIESHYDEPGYKKSGGTRCWLQLRYGELEAREIVSEEEYASVQKGDRVPLMFVAADPQNHNIGGEPRPGEVGVFALALLLVAVIGFPAVLLRPLRLRNERSAPRA